MCVLLYIVHLRCGTTYHWLSACLLVLERTLHLFRDPGLLRREHPLYQMICTPVGALRARAIAGPILAQTKAKVGFVGAA